GGYFTSVGGQTRNHLAAIDATSGAVFSWNPNANSVVTDLLAYSPVVYACGYFSSIAGQSRNHIAAIDAAVGSPWGWNPNADNPVLCLGHQGAPPGNANVIYAGGYFGTIGGQARSRIAALDASSGAATSWNPGAADVVST